MIKLVTIDLDGTLFDNNKKISQHNINMIKKARSQGVYIVLATGRPIEGVLPILNILGLNTNDDYVICYNGGKVYNVGLKKEISSCYINYNDVYETYLYSLKMNSFFHVFDDEGFLYTDKFNHYSDIEAFLNNLELNICSIKHLKKDKYIKSMIVDSKDKIDYIFNNIDDSLKEKYNVVRSSRIFLEFLNKNCDKGEALLSLASYLKIKENETLAIGDASNDIGMIKKAYIGVAMKNSFKEVLDVSDYITLSNEESGVGYAIEKFVIEKEEV